MRGCSNAASSEVVRVDLHLRDAFAGSISTPASPLLLSISVRHLRKHCDDAARDSSSLLGTGILRAIGYEWATRSLLSCSTCMTPILEAGICLTRWSNVDSWLTTISMYYIGIDKTVKRNLGELK